jgi:hypothetical protein
MCPYLKVLGHLVLPVLALDLDGLLILDLEEVVELLVQFILELLVEIDALRAQQVLLLASLHLSQDASGDLLLVAALDAEDGLEGGGELGVGLSGGEGLLSDLDGLEHPQVSDLGEHVDGIDLAGLFVFVGLDAADEVVGG